MAATRAQRRFSSEDAPPVRVVGIAIDDPPLESRVERALDSSEIAHRRLAVHRPASEPSRAGGVDVVLVACESTVTARLDAIRALQRAVPDAAIVVIVTSGMTGLRQTLDLGVCGVIPAREVEAAVAGTVQAVRAGLLVVPRRRRPVTERIPLSHREKQVLELLVLGCTNAVIAQRLFLAESTVKCHLKSIYTKLGVRTRRDAAEVALSATTQAATQRAAVGGDLALDRPAPIGSPEDHPILPPLFASASR